MDTLINLTRFSKFFSFLFLFAGSVTWAKSGGGIKTEIWHENGRHESSESLDHTIFAQNLGANPTVTMAFCQTRYFEKSFFGKIDEKLFFCYPLGLVEVNRKSTGKSTGNRPET